MVLVLRPRSSVDFFDSRRNSRTKDDDEDEHEPDRRRTGTSMRLWLSLFDEDGEGGGVAVEEVLFANRTDFAIAKESRQAGRADELLNVAGVVVVLAKETVTAPVATAKAGAINRTVFDLGAQLLQEHRHVFGAGGGVAPLKLNGLAGPWIGADGQRSRFGIGADEVADEEITAMKFIEVFVHHQADEKVAARFLLVLWWEIAEGFGQNFIGRAVADLVDEIAFRFRDGPGFADGSAALGNDAGQRYIAADGDGYSAFGKDFAVQIDLGCLLGNVAAGEATDYRQRGVGLVPTLQPGFAVELEGISEDKPAVGFFRGRTGFHRPIARTRGFLELVLCKIEGLEGRAGQMIEAEDQPAVFLDLFAAHDEAVAGTADQQGNAGVNAQKFKSLGGVGKEFWRHEDEAE